MAVGRRVLIRNAALLAAAGGCARRIDPSPEAHADLDAAGQIHVPASSAPQLAKPGGSVTLRLRDAVSGSPLGYGLLLANLGSKVIASDRDCPHQGCPLTYVPEDRQIECPCHGSRFTSDGRVLNPPARTDIRTYPVSVDPSGDYTVHFYPGDGTYPTPDASRVLTLDLASYPQLAQVHGYVFGFVEGPPGALVVMRVAADAFVAVDAVCTHQFCTVRPKADGILHCPCHGSEFSADGSQVLAGPAAAPLQHYAATVSGQQLKIDLSRPL